MSTVHSIFFGSFLGGPKLDLCYLCIVMVSLGHTASQEPGYLGWNYYAPRPAERSDAGRGAFYFLAHSDLYQVTTG